MGAVHRGLRVTAVCPRVGGRQLGAVVAADVEEASSCLWTCLLPQQLGVNRGQPPGETLPGFVKFRRNGQSLLPGFVVEL